MNSFVSAVALCLLLTPALAQQSADPQQPPAAVTQPAPQQSGMSQAEAQARANEEQEDSSQAQLAPEQSPLAQPAVTEQQTPSVQSPEVDQSPQTAQPPEIAQPPYSAQQPPYATPPPDYPYPPPQRRTLEVAPGIAPRAEASAYPVHREQRQFSVGARLLSAKEVEQKFSTPLGKHYLVVEVGVFPADAQTVKLRPENFTLRVGSEDQAFFPATPEDIAAHLSPPYGSRPRYVYPSLGVGYRGWGRGVSTGVGVGVGGYPRRGGMAGGNRRVIENELRDKALPQGSLTRASAGYLYFPLSGKRAKQYNLELTGNGENLSLPLQDSRK